MLTVVLHLYAAFTLFATIATNTMRLAYSVKAALFRRVNMTAHRQTTRRASVVT